MDNSAVASIIISNHNYGRFLGEAIDSALNQDLPQTEVIVVDDGSTDDSRKVIASYGSRIIPIFKENGGMDTALNAGVACSKGRIILFLDADDYLLPNCLLATLGEFKGHDVVNTHWPLWVIDRETKRTGAKIPGRPLRHGNLCDCVIHEGPGAWPTVPTSGNAWAGWFLRKIFPVPAHGFKRHAEMYPATLAPVYGEIRSVNEPLSCYRIHGNNDYAAASLESKNLRNLALYDERCKILARELSRLGIAFDPAGWNDGRNAFLWMSELKRMIDILVPRGATFLLADENQWAPLPHFGDRKVVPFTEHHGLYNGPPAGNDAAVGELERLRRQGAGFLVVAWPAFWWLDYYRDFTGYLRAHFHCTFQNESLAVFDLRTDRT